uniref:HDC09819 n=1 Tax=Drosophila melanogaster TaxID=7227 RepID=Q6ILB9_DROME|nr:TPA_inf: HDC09819 [Drosophila melanogaster]
MWLMLMLHGEKLRNYKDTSAIIFSMCTIATAADVAAAPVFAEVAAGAAVLGFVLNHAIAMHMNYIRLGASLSWIRSVSALAPESGEESEQSESLFGCFCLLRNQC